MLRTILLLLVSIIVVPAVSFLFTEPFSGEQMQWLQNLALMAFAIAMYCFIVSEVAGNYSQVDKIWSIAPMIYAWYVAWESNWQPRILLMAVLVSIWGLRLTYNFARRGGYHWKFWEGEEDYRWAILRKKPFLQRKWNWRLFNLFFISLYQNALILLFTLPILAAYTPSSNSLHWLDYLLALVFIFLVIYETIADQQQWNFQTRKYKLLESKQSLEGEYDKGFLSSGLWARSRHPNYFAEQSIWVVFYLFSVVATGQWINWSMIGCLLLLLLFKESSDFSESISAKKYPSYKRYQEEVPRFFPKIS